MKQLTRIWQAVVAFLFGTFLLAWFLLADQVSSGLAVAIWCGLVVFLVLHLFLGPKAKGER